MVNILIFYKNSKYSMDLEQSEVEAYLADAIGGGSALPLQNA